MQIKSKEIPTCLEATTQFPDFYTKNYLEKKKLSEEYLKISRRVEFSRGVGMGAATCLRGDGPQRKSPGL